jgi:hypothetical protein
MALYTLEAVVYQEISVTDVTGDLFVVNPFDLNGNLLPEMTLEVTTTLGVANIALPSINLLNNNWFFKLSIIGRTALTNNVNIIADAGTFNQIGSLSFLQLSNNNTSAILSPINETNWTTLYTP